MRDQQEEEEEVRDQQEVRTTVLSSTVLPLRVDRSVFGSGPGTTGF